MFRKRETQMIQKCTFKKKEKEGSERRLHSVAYGRF
jgi:hypothetical protein